MDKMEKIVLHATHRSVTGKKVGVLRREGKLPGVLYGHHIDPTPITLDLREATKVLSSLTASSLVTVDVEGKEFAALVREKQRNYIKNILLHVDFQAVSLTEKIRTAVSIEMVGVSPAVKDYNGIIVQSLSELEVESLPQDLPERIVVDISSLKDIGSSILVKDIVLSDKVQVLTDGDEVVVVITASKEEAEVEEAAAAEPEVIEKGKKEEEEGEAAK
jgi:large subunit ribosomal protein L25